MCNPCATLQMYVHYPQAILATRKMPMNQLLKDLQGSPWIPMGIEGIRAWGAGSVEVSGSIPLGSTIFYLLKTYI
jgi:hypothetical protein